MIKRFFDILAGGIGLILLLPLFVVVAVAIKLDSPGPVFFRQMRVGRFRKPFQLYKFRTMVEDSELQGKLTVADDPRITRVGSVLRKYKFDEFPQLYNVVKGDMSLVGPRPEVPEYSKCYPEQERVFTVRPGITDPASMMFSRESELLDGTGDYANAYVREILPVKIATYCNYIKNRSLMGDVIIIARTLLLSIKGSS